MHLQLIDTEQEAIMRRFGFNRLADMLTVKDIEGPLPLDKEYLSRGHWPSQRYCYRCKRPWSLGHLCKEQTYIEKVEVALSQRSDTAIVTGQIINSWMVLRAGNKNKISCVCLLCNLKRYFSEVDLQEGASKCVCSLRSDPLNRIVPK